MSSIFFRFVFVTLHTITLGIISRMLLYGNCSLVEIFALIWVIVILAGAIAVNIRKITEIKDEQEKRKKDNNIIECCGMNDDEE